MFVIETDCIFLEVVTKFLNITNMNFGFRVLNVYYNKFYLKLRSYISTQLF